MFVPATEKTAFDTPVTFVNEPPVLNNSIFEMLFVFATTENCNVAPTIVLLPPNNVVNVALREVF